MNSSSRTKKILAEIRAKTIEFAKKMTWMSKKSKFFNSKNIYKKIVFSATKQILVYTPDVVHNTTTTISQLSLTFSLK